MNIVLKSTELNSVEYVVKYSSYNDQADIHYGVKLASDSECM